MANLRSFAIVATLAALGSAPAYADSLYVAPPPPAAAGHPLRLGPDQKAYQAGDTVNVVFNFNVTQSSSATVAKAKSFNAGLAAGTGIAGIGFLRFPSSIGGQSALNTSNAAANSQSFSSAMSATVEQVLPSGNFVVSGVQRVIVNGQIQNMHVTGQIRPVDIDNTNSILSTQMANVELKFDGNYFDKKPGLLTRVLNWIF